MPCMMSLPCICNSVSSSIFFVIPLFSRISCHSGLLSISNNSSCDISPERVALSRNLSIILGLILIISGIICWWTFFVNRSVSRPRTSKNITVFTSSTKLSSSYKVARILTSGCECEARLSYLAITIIEYTKAATFTLGVWQLA